MRGSVKVCETYSDVGDGICLIIEVVAHLRLWCSSPFRPTL